MQIRHVLAGLTAITTISVLAAAPATAQRGGPGMMSRMQALTDTVVVRMQLTGDQETAFRAIMTDQGESMKAIFDEYGGARDPQMREDMMALQQETTEKLGTIFSEEQMAQYQKLLGELRAQMRGGRGPGGPPQG